jgi:hypothetical protein
MDVDSLTRLLDYEGQIRSEAHLGKTNFQKTDVFWTGHFPK